MYVNYVRVEVFDRLPSGQVKVHLLADGAEGFCFYTEPEKLLTAADIMMFNGPNREQLQFVCGVMTWLASNGDERDKEIAEIVLPKLENILYPKFATGEPIKPLASSTAVADTAFANKVNEFFKGEEMAKIFFSQKDGDEE